MERTQAKYFKPDVLNTFLNLEKPMSRAELVARTGLGEGSMRSILNILKAKGLIQSSKRGHWATKRGLSLLRELQRQLDILEPRSLKFPKSREILCFHIRGPVNQVPSYLLRDIAVRWGATGALIFRFNGRQLVLPPSRRVDYNEDYSALTKGLEKEDHLALLWGEHKPSLVSGGLEIASVLSPAVGSISGRL